MKSLFAPFLIILPLFAASCQSYTPAPLNLRDHARSLEARSATTVAGGAVAAYAQQIGRRPSTAPFDSSDGLSLPEAEVVALFFNPQLRIARLRANVARVGAVEAGRWEDPELAVDAERIIESVDEPWVIASSLSFTLPISGRLGMEKKQARAEVALAEMRALADERAALAELRAAWAEWSALRERAALTRKVIAQLLTMSDRAERLREAGELDPVDAGLLRLEMVKRSGDLRKFEADARSGEMQLKTRLGLVSSANVTLIPTVTGVAGFDAAGVHDLAARVAEHPRAKVAEAEYEVAERTLELQVRRQYPDLKLGGGYGTDEGDERVLFGAAMPLPLLNANRRAIAEARANREVARANAEAAYEQLLGDAAAALAQLDGADARVRYVEQELAPLADRQVSDAQRLASAGELNAVVLLEALRTAHEAKLEVLDARLALGLARSRAEALLEGVPPAAPAAPATAPVPVPTTREVQP